MTRLTSSLGAVLLLALAAALVAQSNPYPVNWKELPAPFHTPAVRNAPQVIPQPAGAKLAVPPGFVVQEYMAGFVRPRFMLLGPGDEVLLADSGSASGGDGVIYLLRNGTKTPIIEKLDRPYGLAHNGNTLWVAETTSVKRYPYDPKAMRVTGPGQEIVSLRDFGGGHWTRTLLFNRGSHEAVPDSGLGLEHRSRRTRHARGSASVQPGWHRS